MAEKIRRTCSRPAEIWHDKCELNGTANRSKSSTEWKDVATVTCREF